MSFDTSSVGAQLDTETPTTPPIIAEPKADYKPYERMLMEKGFSEEQIDDHRALLARSGVGEEVAARFDAFVKIAPQSRLTPAVWNLIYQERAGLVVRELPDPETVYEHYCSLVQFVRDYQDERLDDALRQEVVEMLEVHDLVEGITTDFSPHNEIYQEKDLLEEMAAAILFEGYPEKKILFEEFEKARQPDASEAARLALDFDKIQGVIRSALVEADHPEEARKIQERSGLGLFEDFNEGLEAKIQTDIGRDLLAKLQHSEQREVVLGEYRAAEAKCFGESRRRRHAVNPTSTVEDIAAENTVTPVFKSIRSSN